MELGTWGSMSLMSLIDAVQRVRMPVFMDVYECLWIFMEGVSEADD